MITKILIANRGEIACRVIRTARRMGIGTVAVYSDADAAALHVEMADQAVRIGPAAASESYLKIDAILEAAKATGAEAIHPGYGFLSENPDFVEAVEAAGLTFIGPSAHAIRAMGLKDRAKALMHDAGVPVVPGYHGDRQDAAFLAGEADQIGYPVLIKAVAGGGGKGMRLVERAADFADALTGARAEAKAAFGNEDVLIEKFVTNPRHIEVQVFGDGSKAVHLYERDCSLQRRHQKVIEEAPAPGMTAEVRAAMGQAAVLAAEAIGYAGAGTVEFIVDGSGPLRADGFWFMEMNTRLQVEHPVTEAVTGFDLVEWQLRVAAGAPLPVSQEQIPLQGHAVEARLYAEDPANGFLPAVGTLTHLRFPPGLRVESGVRAGGEISPHYDPMIAKVIAHAPTRAEAISALRRGLSGVQLAGTVTNLGFLSRLLEMPDFVAGTMDTGLIDQAGDALSQDPAAPRVVWAVAALAAMGLPAPGADGWHMWVPLRQSVVLEHGSARETLVVKQPRAGVFEVAGLDGGVTLDAVCPGPEGWRVTTGGQQMNLLVSIHDREVSVAIDGAQFRFTRPDPLDVVSGDAATEDAVRAPMPGLVRRLEVVPGQAVAQGDLLLVLEAMKMEHSLRAPRDGHLAEVLCAEGAQVAQGDVLVSFEVADD